MSEGTAASRKQSYDNNIKMFCWNRNDISKCWRLKNQTESRHDRPEMRWFNGRYWDTPGQGLLSNEFRDDLDIFSMFEKPKTREVLGYIWHCEFRNENYMGLFFVLNLRFQSSSSITEASPLNHENLFMGKIMDSISFNDSKTCLIIRQFGMKRRCSE